MRGWLLDIYADDASDSMVYWVRTRRGAERVVDRSFLPKIYAHSSPDKMDDLEGALPVLDAVKSVKREMKRTWLGEKEREGLLVKGSFSRARESISGLKSIPSACTPSGALT